MASGFENITTSAIYTATLSDETVLHFRKYVIDDLGRREAFIKEQRFNIEDRLAAMLKLTASLKDAVDLLGDDKTVKNQILAIMLGAVKDGVQEAFSQPNYVSLGEEAQFEMSRLGLAYELYTVCLEFVGDMDKARMFVHSLNPRDVDEILAALDKARERTAIKNSDSPSHDESQARGSEQGSENTSTSIG